MQCAYRRALHGRKRLNKCINQSGEEVFHYCSVKLGLTIDGSPEPVAAGLSGGRRGGDQEPELHPCLVGRKVFPLSGQRWPSLTSAAKVAITSPNPISLSIFPPHNTPVRDTAANIDAKRVPVKPSCLPICTMPCTSLCSPSLPSLGPQYNAVAAVN